MADERQPDPEAIQTATAVIGFAMQDVVQQRRVARQTAVQAQVDHDRQAVSRGSDILLSIINGVADDIIDSESPGGLQTVTGEWPTALTGQSDSDASPASTTYNQAILSDQAGQKRSFSEVSTESEAMDATGTPSGPQSTTVDSLQTSSGLLAERTSSEPQGEFFAPSFGSFLRQSLNGLPISQPRDRDDEEPIQSTEHDASDQEITPPAKRRKRDGKMDDRVTTQPLDTPADTATQIVRSRSPSAEASSGRETSQSRSRDQAPVPQAKSAVKTAGQAKQSMPSSRSGIKTSRAQPTTPSKAGHLRVGNRWHEEEFTAAEQEKQRAHGYLSHHNELDGRTRSAQKKAQVKEEK